MPMFHLVVLGLNFIPVEGMLCLSIKRRFINAKGDVDTFHIEPNPLNKNQMYWFDSSPAMFAGSLKDAKDIEAMILDNLEILEE